MRMAFFNTKKQVSTALLGVIMSAICLATFGATAQAASPGTVVITEFIANPAVVSDANGEWVEIKNATATAVDLTNWDIDGSTIVTTSGSFILERNASAVICKNTSRILNDGVVCDGSSNFSLGNTSDTINLRDETNAVIDSVSYGEGVAQEGKSTDAVTLLAETTKKYSVNNFGQPAHNQTNPPSLPGTIYVQHAIDANKNNWPDWANGEPHYKGRTVRLYATDGAVWTYKDTITTKSTTFQATAKFTVQPDSYALCEVAADGYTQSFTRTIVGWYHAPEVGATNLSSATDEYAKCIPTNVSPGEASSHAFGDYAS